MLPAEADALICKVCEIAPPTCFRACPFTAHPPDAHHGTVSLRYQPIPPRLVLPHPTHPILQRSGMNRLYPQYRFFFEGRREQLMMIAQKCSKNRTSNYHVFDMKRGGFRAVRRRGSVDARSTIAANNESNSLFKRFNRRLAFKTAVNAVSRCPGVYIPQRLSKKNGNYLGKVRTNLKRTEATVFTNDQASR